MLKYIKFEILYCFIYAIILHSMIVPLACYCYEHVQTVTITKEDIQNAKGTPSPVEFSEKDLKKIEMMEKRHFLKTYPELDDSTRLRNLEFELLGRCWRFSPQDTRIRKLGIASSNAMISGTALPASISSRRNAKRMSNNSIEMRKKDNPGLIDGFLRLMSPEKYEQYRRYSEDMYYKYEY